jgi:colicin import membrane protein
MGLGLSTAALDAQDVNRHVVPGYESEIRQSDTDLAANRAASSAAMDAVLAARREASAARLQANNLRAQKIRAKLADDQKAFDDAIAAAEAEAGSKNAEADRQYQTVRDLQRTAEKLTVERLRYQSEALSRSKKAPPNDVSEVNALAKQKAKREAAAANQARADAKEAEALNKQKVKRRQPY